MAGFISKLFGKTAPVEALEDAVIRIYKSLPECTSRLLIAGPAIGDTEFLENVYADAHSLLRWAESRASMSYGNTEIQAYMDVLPIWLRSASASDEPTIMPIQILEAIRPWATDLISSGIADVFCSKCNELRQEMERREVRPNRDGANSDKTVEWYCPSGHLLYRARSATHISRRSRYDG